MRREAHYGEGVVEASVHVHFSKNFFYQLLFSPYCSCESIILWLQFEIIPLENYLERSCRNISNRESISVLTLISALTPLKVSRSEMFQQIGR